MKRVLGSIAVAGACAAALLTAGAPASAGAPPSPTITPVLGGLSSPRGIAFDGQGAMYISESGAAGTQAAGLTRTGKVSKYPKGWHKPAWTHTFTSFYGPSPGGGTDVLGPEGISAMGNRCTNGNGGRTGWNRRWHRHDCQVAVILSESTPGILNGSGGTITDNQAGRLYQLDGRTGTIRKTSNVGGQMYDWTGDHVSVFPSDFPDSNPYAVLVTKDADRDRTRTFVADAGANTINEIMANGRARIVSYIPNESGPPFRDATPTCIAQGPDGYLYVGTLHFVANLLVPPGTGGFSDVWRVNPDANYPSAPQLWASGLGTVTGCTFDRAGNFWAAEMFGGGFSAQPFPGDVVKMPFAHPNQQTHIGAGQIPVPGGIAQGPDGDMYVTVGAATGPGQGGVFKIG